MIKRKTGTPSHVNVRHFAILMAINTNMGLAKGSIGIISSQQLQYTTAGAQHYTITCIQLDQ